MSQMTDQTLKCNDCKQDFVFTAGEQAFFAEKGFTPPRRCKPCRDFRKQEKQQNGGGNGGNGGHAGHAGNGGGFQRPAPTHPDTRTYVAETGYNWGGESDRGNGRDRGGKGRRRERERF